MRIRSKTVARLLPGLAALGCVAVVAPPAQAAGETITGGCFASADENEVLTNGQHQGIIGDASLTRDSNGPASATVYCEIHVNGSTAPGTAITASGLGVQSNVVQISFSAGPLDKIELCQEVVFSPPSTFDSGQTCQSTVNDVVIPEPVIGPANQVFQNDIDPLLCPIFVTLSRAAVGFPGLLEFRDDGDVYIADPLGLGLNPVYDCPPYGNF